MKNAVVLSAAFVLCVVTLAKSGDSKEDVKAMEGTWLPLSAELSGAKFPDEVLKIMKLTLKGETYSVDIGGKIDKGMCKIDAGKKPKTLDVTGTEGPNQGKTLLAIYELTKDSLKVCYDLSGKERPKDFKSEKGTQQFLVVYQREKK